MSRVQRLEDILAESDDDDDSLSLPRSAAAPAARSATTPAAQAKLQQRTDLMSILASTNDSDSDEDDMPLPVTTKAHARPTQAQAKPAVAATPAAQPAAAKPAAPAVAKPATPAVAAPTVQTQPLAAAPAVTQPTAAAAAATASVPTPVVAPTPAAAATPAPAAVGAPVDVSATQPALTVAAPSSSVPVSTAAQQQRNPALASAMADSDSEADEESTSASTATTSTTTIAVTPAPVVSAVSVPVGAVRRSSEAAPPTTLDADSVLPPPRGPVRRVSVGSTHRSVSGGSTPSSPQTHERSEAEEKAEKQRARQLAKEQMLQAAASKPSSPLHTPPRSRRQSSSTSNSAVPDATLVTHSSLSFETSARVPVTGTNTTAAAVMQDSSSDSDDDILSPVAATVPVAHVAPTTATASNITAKAVAPSSSSSSSTAGKSSVTALQSSSRSMLHDILNQAESDDEEVDLDAAAAPKVASGLASGSSTNKLVSTVNLSDDSSDEETEAEMKGLTAAKTDAKTGASVTKSAGTAATSLDAAKSPTHAQLMSEAELLKISDPLTRAEVLEQNLSTLGNYTVLNPLAAQTGKARSIAPIMGKDKRADMLVPASAAASAHLVRLTALTKVQGELHRSRHSIGHPTACCLHIHSKFLCVGTSRGLVLFFDRGFEGLMYALGKEDAASKARGAITCLDLNVAGDQLLVGYSKGAICIWDVTHKSLIKTIPDAAPNLPITMLKFTNSHASNQAAAAGSAGGGGGGGFAAAMTSGGKTSTFISADTQGCLNLFTLHKQLFSYGVDKQVLLQGKAGPVLASSVLNSTPSFPHVADRLALVAIATEAVTSIVALEPSVAIVYRVSREPNERVGAQPTLAWRPLHPRDECLTNTAFAQGPDGALVPSVEAELVRHPTLLVCRGRSFSLLQALPLERAEQLDSGRKQVLKFRTLVQQTIPPEVVERRVDGRIEPLLVPREIKSCSWLAQGQLIALIVTPSDDILIFDPFSQPLLCLATLSGATIGIVHQEFFFHPERGNPELTFTPSIHATDDCMLLLGTDNVSEVRVLPWSQRLDAFVVDTENPQWHHCLALSVDLFNGAAFCPFPLPRDRASVHRTMQGRMIELIGNFITVMLQGNNSQTGRTAGSGELDLLTNTRAAPAATAQARIDERKHVKVLGGVCIAYCIAIGRLDLLFGEIYDKFKHHFPYPFASSAGLNVAGVASASALLSGLSSTSSSPVSLGSELFLELLEGYVLTDQIVTLPPHILSDLFPLYHHRRRLPELEQMLLHLNPVQLDLGHLMPLIRAYRMFSACIYMYNRGMSAFDRPLDDILGVLTDPVNLAASSGSLLASPALMLLPTTSATSAAPLSPLGPLSSMEKSSMAYKLLLYIDYCFLGRAFPRKGDLPREYRAGVRAQVLSVLFRKEVTIADTISLPSYPYLAYFLNLHTADFLSILSIVFEERDEEWLQYVQDDEQKMHIDMGASAAGTGAPSFDLLSGDSSVTAAPAPVPSPSHATTDNSSGSGSGSASHSRAPSTTSTMGSFMSGATFSSFRNMLSPSSASQAAAAATSATLPHSLSFTDGGGQSDAAAAPAGMNPSSSPAPSPVAPVSAPPQLPATAYLPASHVPSRQQLLDALLFLILDQLQEAPPATSTSHAAMMLPFTYQPHASHLHELFKFAAKYLARGSVKASKNFSQRIFLYLCSNEGGVGGDGLRSPSDMPLSPTSPTSPSSSTASTAVSDFVSDRAARQRMLLSLLGRVPDFDADTLLKQATAANFHGVLAVLHIRRGDFARTLDAMLRGIESKEDTVLPATLLHAAPPDAFETTILQAVCNKPLVQAVFDFIHVSLTNPALTPQKTAAIRSATLQVLPQLVAAHSERTARLILADFLTEHDRVMQALNAFPQLQFQYLKSVMSGHTHSQGGSSSNSSSSSGGGGAGGADQDAHPGVDTNVRELSMTELLQRSGLQFTTRMHEQYIQLLCIYSRSDVLTHVSSHQDYNIDSALKLCQQYHIDDASAFLMERMGDLQGAMELMLTSVDQRVLELRRLIEAEYRNYPEPHSPSDVQSLSAVHASLRRQSGADDGDRALVPPPSGAGESASLVHSPAYLALDKEMLNTVSTASLLCQRSNDPEKLWFTLLDRFVHLQRTIKQQHTGRAEKATGKSSKKAEQAPAPSSSSSSSSDVRSQITAPMSDAVFLYLQSALFSYVRLVLGSMMQHLDLHHLMNKIVTDHQGDSLREFRDTIQGLLDTYSYEQSILTTANALLSSDKFHSIEQLQRRKAQALQPVTDSCGICARPLADGQFVDKFILFTCGHLFHVSCLGKQADSCMICQRETTAKKRTGSRAGGANATTAAADSVPPPVLSPTSQPASTPSSQSGGAEKASLEIIQRLQLSERRFDKGCVRSIDSFNARLRRFGRGGLDDNTNDDGFLRGAPSPPQRNPFDRNPFAHEEEEEEEGGEGAHDDEHDEYSYSDGVSRRPAASSSTGGPSLDSDESDYFQFQMPSIRADLTTPVRQPGTISRPLASKSLDLQPNEFD